MAHCSSCDRWLRCLSAVRGALFEVIRVVEGLHLGEVCPFREVLADWIQALHVMMYLAAVSTVRVCVVHDLLAVLARVGLVAP